MKLTFKPSQEKSLSDQIYSMQITLSVMILTLWVVYFLVKYAELSASQSRPVQAKPDQKEENHGSV